MHEKSDKKPWVTPSAKPIPASDEILKLFEPEVGFKPPAEREHLVQASQRLVKLRQRRQKYVPSKFLGEPGWDIMLAIHAYEHVYRGVSISSLAKMTGTASSSALRWVGQLVDAGLIVRQGSSTDRRSANVKLAEDTRHALDRYLEHVEVAFDQH